MAILNNAPLQGNITGINGGLLFDCNGMAMASINIAGTYVGTITVQGSIDGVSFAPLPIQTFREGFGWQPITLASAATGGYMVACSQYAKIRVILSAWTSGIANIAFLGSAFIHPRLLQQRESDLIATNTGIAGAAVTLTIPAATGLFHYINRIEVESHKSATVTAQITPNIVTTTNLYGVAFSIPYEGVAGSAFNKPLEFSTSLRSQAAGTATTIVYPAIGSVISRITAYYYIGL